MTDQAEPLLSPDETSALLNAMRPRSDKSASAEPADLGSPERPLREALANADVCARAMAASIDRLILRVTGSSSFTEELPAEIAPYKVIRNSIPQGAAVVTLTASDGNFGFMTIGPMLVAFILDGRMGAPLGGERAIEPRNELTALDRRLLEPVTRQIAEALGKQWCNDPTAIKPSQVLSRSADLPSMAQFEPLLQIAMRVAPAGMAGDQIILALSGGLVALGRPSEAIVKRVPRKPKDRKEITLALQATEVNAVAVLGQAPSTIRELLSLQRGDVIRLGSHPLEPIELRAGDRTVFLATPLVRHGNLAVQIAQVNGRNDNS
jgi:flagellar motor switch protein FliM